MNDVMFKWWVYFPTLAFGLFFTFVLISNIEHCWTRTGFGVTTAAAVLKLSFLRKSRQNALAIPRFIEPNAF
jgi:hypothetical protein